MDGIGDFNMKICFIINSMRGGGAERVISILASNYAKENSVVIITLLSNKKSVYPIDENVKLISLPKYKNKIEMLFKIPKDLYNVMKTINADIYISFCTMENVFSLLANKKLNKKLIISERNSPKTEEINPIFKMLRKILYKNADDVIFQTEDALIYYKTHFGIHGHVIPNPVKNDLPVATLKDKTRICAVGRLYPQKNYPLLINAFTIFHQKHEEYTLEIYGEGILEDKLTELIKINNMEKYITLKGFSNDIHNDIKDCRMYILSSDYEGMPNSLLEALSIGLPCIATNCPIGGPKQLIDNGKNGLLVNIGDVEQMVHAMNYLATDIKTCENLSIEATKIRNKYSVTNIINLWNDVLYSMR